MIDKKMLVDYLEADLIKVRRIVTDSLESDITLLNQTNDSILSHPGKMMRPMLALLVAKACSNGCLTEDSYAFAAASELLHNATLLHDDVADNSPSRRGRPTVMNILGGRASVLLGDFWLVRAMNRLLESKDHYVEAIRLFSKTLGDLAEGEMLQLQKAGSGDTEENDYYRIIYSKTASLFEAAAVSGAVSVDADPLAIEAVRKFAYFLGIAFQIKDDIFDYQPSAEIGKPVGHDLLEQKITLPLIGALLNAPQERAKEIRRKVTMIMEHPEYQAEIVAFVEEFRGMEYAEAKLAEHIAVAVSSLGVLPSGKDRDCLEALARLVASRNS